MHDAAYKQMATLLEKVPGGPARRVLDVGSLDVNGTYRPLVEGLGWEYTGLDMRPGKNVDVVADTPYEYGFADNAFDVVISGSTMEHVQAIWLWVPELVRVLKPGGYLAIITHWRFNHHRYPVDCWRIMPDGMKYLFDQTNQLQDYYIEMVNESDIVGAAYKALA